MHNKAIIHIGLPKCASTSLQKLFTSHEGIYYLGKNVSEYRTQSLERLFREYVTGTPETQYDYPYVQSLLLPHMQAASNDNKILVISDELFSGIGFRSYIYQRFIDPALLLRRLAEAFEDVSFIVVIREQKSFLRSFYAEMVGHGLNITYQQFVEREFSAPSNLKSVLSYGSYIRHLQSHYTDTQVVLFEQLVSNQATVREILGRYGIAVEGGLSHVNKRFNQNQTFKILVNNTVSIRGCGNYPAIQEFLHAREILSVNSGNRMDAESLYTLDDSARSLLDTTFAPENAMASELLGIDLSFHNYIT